MESRHIIRSINLSASRRSMIRQCPLSRSSPSFLPAIARPLSNSSPRYSSGQASSPAKPEDDSASSQQQQQSESQSESHNQPITPLTPKYPPKADSQQPTNQTSNTGSRSIFNNTSSITDNNLDQVTSILNDLKPRSPRTANNIFDPRHSRETDMYRKVRDAMGQSQKSRVPPVNLRLGPELGRTIAVDTKAGVSVATAFQMMESRVRKNRVKNMLMNQRFHVRRGQRKKQLRRERWQKLFKFSFQHTVARCEKLRKQGW
ncbi:hypothetical protein AJ79_01598 [Helicocarpus griseus UAMH5409]|uniref:Ribosomal protein S21 n=1 Tax=Helicocarpus griseus UAMH5409 TaxID=1447875 RepID=A0A2B7Y6A0_9EURO|nr:hypothetical protein AJ79_01598 [Helicocarpus griseus UAMH5409]